MSACAVISRTWKVDSYSVTLTMPRRPVGATATAVVEWVPSKPLRLSALEFEQYRAGRDAAIAEMVHELGIEALVVDL
jgi:hypothetical protein